MNFKVNNLFFLQIFLIYENYRKYLAAYLLAKLAGHEKIHHKVNI